MCPSSFTLHRLIRLCVMVTLFALAGGQVASAFEVDAAVLEACEQTCPAEDDKGQCAQQCEFCTCCSLQQLKPIRSSQVAPLELSLSLYKASSCFFLPNTEPSGILHVPKSHSA